MINIESFIREKSQERLRLGIVTCKVKVDPSPPGLLDAIAQQCSKIENELEVDDINHIPTIQATRKFYRALGKDPSRYRPSAESLHRRVVKGKGLYQVNNVVDCLNLVSLQTGYSIGGYDADKIEGEITLGAGKSNEPYQGIGRGELNIENLPVLRDDKGAFGTPTSDSMRTSVTDSCKSFLMVFFDFGGEQSLANLLDSTKELLMDFANGSEIKVSII